MSMESVTKGPFDNNTVQRRHLRDKLISFANVALIGKILKNTYTFVLKHNYCRERDASRLPP